MERAQASLMERESLTSTVQRISEEADEEAAEKAGLVNKDRGDVE